MIGRSARIIDGRMKFGSMSIGDDNALMIPRVSRSLLWRSPRKVSREQKEKKRRKEKIRATSTACRAFNHKKLR